jgi:hypothetical protein
MSRGPSLRHLLKLASLDPQIARQLGRVATHFVDERARRPRDGRGILRPGRLIASAPRDRSRIGAR